MPSMLLPIILGFLVMMSAPAYAGWEAIAISEIGMTVYIDRASIQRDRYFVTMSVLHDYQSPEQLSAGAFLSFTSQQQYDCGERRSRIMATVVFTDHMGNGTVLYSGIGDDTWQPVTPMSINYALWETACPEGTSVEVASLLPSGHPDRPANARLFLTAFLSRNLTFAFP